MTAKQTLSYLKRRFAEAGIRPRTKLGQNFLTDPNLQRLLVESAQLEPDDVVLEVGTGTGSLTLLMAPRVAAVVTVEVDPRLFQLAAEELHGLANVHMLPLDALRGKSQLQPAMLEAVERELAASPKRQWKLVANLPYVIATPLVANLLARERPPRSMTITIQKELAERIAAAPGSKDYGALSVWVQSQCRVSRLRTVPPSVFWPRPKVTSAMVQIVVDDSLRSRIADREFFHGFVRTLFVHRRKLLRTALASAWKGRLDKPGLDRLLAHQGLDPGLRAEQLDVERILALGEALRAECRRG